MPTDAKTLLEDVGAEMRKELEGAVLAPLGVPIALSKDHDFDFGVVCVRAAIRAGLEVRTREGEIVVLKEESNGPE
jgi:hypothetical protein